MTNQLLTETQAADILGLKPATLRRWRWEGNTVLPWIKLGGAIRYDHQDIVQFIQESRCVICEGAG